MSTDNRARTRLSPGWRTPETSGGAWPSADSGSGSAARRRPSGPARRSDTWSTSSRRPVHRMSSPSCGWPARSARPPGSCWAEGWTYRLVVRRLRRTPVLEELPAWECWSRLASGGIGRVAVSTEEGPVVLPVKLPGPRWHGDLPYRRGRHDGRGHRRPGRLRGDHIDEALRTGSSVLVKGAATVLDEPEAIEHLTRRGSPDPWAGGAPTCGYGSSPPPSPAAGSASPTPRPRPRARDRSRAEASATARRLPNVAAVRHRSLSGRGVADS
ncbi:pyridoxamine 5'-phosphate oxidase-like protein [Streptomyces sp. TLI_235]|nr:pyridoxamine 5'-phosphate oxidase-like protein [Streptomyces sp. TLI_235]